MRSQADCNKFLTGCRYNGLTCVPEGMCNTYEAIGEDETARRDNC